MLAKSTSVISQYLANFFFEDLEIIAHMVVAFYMLSVSIPVYS